MREVAGDERKSMQILLLLILCSGNKSLSSAAGRSGTTFNQFTFLEFVEDCLVPILGRFPEPNSVVVMDNARFHASSAVRAAIEGARAVLLFLPTYSPDLNPIELAFSKVKAGLRRKFQLAWRNPHLALICALMMVTSADAQGYFRHCGYIGSTD